MEDSSRYIYLIEFVKLMYFDNNAFSILSTRENVVPYAFWINHELAFALQVFVARYM